MNGRQRVSRAERLTRTVLRETTDIIVSMKDPRAVSLSVSGVRVSPDLRHATVYYTLANPAQRTVAEQFLAAARGFIRSQLAQRITLKFALELDFVYDTVAEESRRVLDLLDRIRHEQGE